MIIYLDVILFLRNWYNRKYIRNFSDGCLELVYMGGRKWGVMMLMNIGYFWGGSKSFKIIWLCYKFSILKVNNYIIYIGKMGIIWIIF